MKKFYLYFAAALGGMMTLVSCTKEVINEEMAEPDSRLTVMTRSSGDVEVKYPVRLYVFGNDDGCKAMQTLENAESSFSSSLPAGSYDIYAIGGADPNLYELPTKEEATKTSVIAVKSGQSLGDLMTAHSTITLVSDGSNAVTLGMERKVIMVKSVVINNVPTEATSVSVSISPLQQTLLLNGNYQGEAGSCSITLTKQSDGTTWKSESDTNYQMPSVGKPTITVTIGSNAYSYTCSEELAANHKISISGTFKSSSSGSADITLSGTINGVAWGSDNSIEFEFEDDNSGNDAVNVPAVGDIYKGCYVLSVNGNQVTLLSPSQKIFNVQEDDNQTTLNTKINSELANWENTISTNWRLMNKKESQYIMDNYRAINYSDIGVRFINSSIYLLKEEGEILIFTTSSLTFLPIGTDSPYLRPVTTITVE